MVIQNKRRIKKMFLAFIMLLSLPASVILAILKTGDGHNKIFSCIHFGLIEFFLCLSTLLIINEVKTIILETISIIFFSTWVLFCLTVVVITSYMNDLDRWYLLYASDSGGFANWLFWGYVFLGAVTSILIIKKRLDKLEN